MTYFLLVPILLLAAPASAPDNPLPSDGTKPNFIEAEGSGATSEEALKDAFRAVCKTRGRSIRG